MPERSSGVQFRADFFGWLVAAGVAVLLLALVGAIGGPIAGGSFANTRQAAGAAGTMV